MAYDGNGNFLRLHNWTADAANGIDINASEMDGEDNGFAAGLSNCVTRDGQGKMSVNFLPSADNTLTLGSGAYRWSAVTAVAVNATTLNATTINGNLNNVQTALELAAGVTPVNTQYSPGNVLRYATNTTPGVTDMTTAFLNALKSNPVIYVPGSGGPYLCASNLTGVFSSGQTFYGDGKASLIKFSSAANQNSIDLNGVNDFTIKGLALQVTAAVGTNNYQGIVGLRGGSLRCTVENLDISGHYACGVTLENGVSNCKITKNNFHDGQGTIQDGCDIMLIGLTTDVGCNNNDISNNQCLGGLWHGICGLVGAACNAVHLANSVVNNTCVGQQSYGIVLHTGAVSADWNWRIGYNHVENVQGTALAGASGAGIYVVGAGGCTLGNNKIRNCCQSTSVETLAPAGIGISTLAAGLSPTVLNGNEISEMPKYHGILVTTCASPVIINGNPVNMPVGNANGAGIKVNGCSNCSVSNNPVVMASVQAGVLVQATTSAFSNNKVNNNQIQTTTGTAIFFSSVTGGTFPHADVKDNTCTSSGNATMLSATNLSDGSIGGNIFDNNNGAGTPVTLAACTNMTLGLNRINGGSTVALSITGTCTGTVVEKSNILTSVAGGRSGQNAINNGGTGAHVEQLGTAAPGFGTAVLGDAVYNTAGVTPFAWSCTAAGSPGTWTGLTLP